MITSFICNVFIFLHNLLLRNLHRKGKNSVAVELWQLLESEQGDCSRQGRKTDWRVGKEVLLLLFVGWLVFVGFISMRLKWERSEGHKRRHITSDRHLRMKLSWNHKLILTYFFMYINILWANTMEFSLYVTFKNIYYFLFK